MMWLLGVSPNLDPNLQPLRSDRVLLGGGRGQCLGLDIQMQGAWAFRV